MEPPLAYVFLFLFFFFLNRKRRGRKKLLGQGRHWVFLGSAGYDLSLFPGQGSVYNEAFLALK